MGTITSRKRKDGSVGYTAQIRIKQQGVIIHTESQTFDRKAAAGSWLKKRETELAKPGALDKSTAPDPLLKDVIAQYLQELRKPAGSTKAQVLRSISVAPIGSMACSTIGSKEVLEFAQSLQVKPQTVGNYLAHLGTVFKVAEPAWGYPLDFKAIETARAVGKRMGVTSKSVERNRRPTLEELEKLLDHYVLMAQRKRARVPMVDIVLFALFSTRRQEEITRILWSDLDEKHSEVVVRDMKHPGEKIGNDVRVLLPDEAMAIVLRQPRKKDRIFPFSAESISASFTRACSYLGIEDLHFHDLRHEGISRLFEMGRTIPQAATVSGHRTWNSLKRYSHIRRDQDKYAGWKWNPLLSFTESTSS